MELVRFREARSIRGGPQRAGHEKGTASLSSELAHREEMPQPRCELSSVLPKGRVGRLTDSPPHPYACVRRTQMPC